MNHTDRADLAAICRFAITEATKIFNCGLLEIHPEHGAVVVRTDDPDAWTLDFWDSSREQWRAKHPTKRTEYVSVGVLADPYDVRKIACAISGGGLPLRRGQDAVTEAARIAPALQKWKERENESLDHDAGEITAT